MGKKRLKAEEIVAKLRQVEVLTAQIQLMEPFSAIQCYLRVNQKRCSRSRGTSDTLKPLLDEMRAEGLFGYEAMARGLNARGLPAPRGGQWSGVQVKRLVGTAFT